MTEQEFFALCGYDEMRTVTFKWQTMLQPFSEMRTVTGIIRKELIYQNSFRLFHIEHSYYCIEFKDVDTVY